MGKEIRALSYNLYVTNLIIKIFLKLDKQNFFIFHRRD